MAAYHDALTPVFLALVPLLLLSTIALCFLRPVPLATTVGAGTDGGGPDLEDAPSAVASGHRE